MSTKLIAKTTLLGLMIWAVPFMTGFFFYDQTGQLNVNIFFFKSVMIVVLTAVSALAIHWSFKPINNSFTKHGILIGAIGLVVVFLLDAMVLIPMTGMTVAQYMAEIGLRYLIIPIMAVSSGLLLHRHQ